MEPPVPPDEADCCNSFCNPCIFDVYEDQLRKYNKLISNGSNSSSNSNLTNCMNEAAYAVFKIVQITRHTDDTYLYTFEYVKPHRGGHNLKKSELSLTYQPGQHFLMRATLPQSQDYFTRAYTPIPTCTNKPLCFTILIRLYGDGLMSRFIRRLKPGANTLWRGPYGNFTIDYAQQHVVFIAQGTGIAPIYSVIKALLTDDDYEAFLKLYFCCRNGKDILLRNDLYELSAHWNFSYEIFVTCKEGNITTKYNEVVNARRLGKSDLGGYLGDKMDKRVQVLICGGDSFTANMLEHVTGLNVDSSQVFVF